MKKKVTIQVLKYLFLGLVSVICIYPIIWLLINSLKTNDQLLLNPWSMSTTFHWENYVEAWVGGRIGRSLINSVIICAVSLTLTIILSTMAAFALARLKWKLAGLVMGLFLTGLMIPIHSTLIPLFILFTKLNILNTHLALILPYTAFALPISIFILTGFMKTCPRQLEEAAVIDGATVRILFTDIIAPISGPAIATISIFNFIGMWNELVYAIVFLNDANLMTLPVCLTNFKGQYMTNWVAMLAAIVIIIIPSLVLYIFLNKKIIQGMTSGALKG
jgi:raffinose/stachyose/melibiose transport system permease protein